MKRVVSNDINKVAQELSMGLKLKYLYQTIVKYAFLVLSALT